MELNAKLVRRKRGKKLDTFDVLVTTNDGIEMDVGTLYISNNVARTASVLFTVGPGDKDVWGAEDDDATTKP